MRLVVRTIPTVAALLVAAASFVLSFVALRDVAAEVDAVPDQLAWLLPIVVDGGVLAASASLWASSYQQTRRDPVAYLTVASLLAFSVVVNINHAGPTPLAKAIAALPPIVLLACLELVAAQHRRDGIPGPAPARGVAAEAPLPPVPHVAELHIQTGASSTAHDLTTPSGGPAGAAARFDRAPETFGAPATGAPSEAFRELLPVEAAPQPVPVGKLSPTNGSPETQQVAATVGEPSTTAPATATKPGPTATPDPTPGPSTPASRSRGRKTVRVTAEAAIETSASDSITQRYRQHVAAGGAPHDPTLATRIAGELNVTPAYVRKVLKPLRDASPGATDSVLLGAPQLT